MKFIFYIFIWLLGRGEPADLLQDRQLELNFYGNNTELCHLSTMLWSIGTNILTISLDYSSCFIFKLIKH